MLSRLLLQEWVFLTSESWIAARRHTTFNYFKKAGTEAELGFWVYLAPTAPDHR